MVKNWAMKTPKNFKFTAKFPKVITHDKRLLNVDKELEHFFDVLGPLENKTLALLLQLPPSLQIFTGLERLRELAPLLDPRFRYAVEVRHYRGFRIYPTVSLQITIFVWFGAYLPNYKLHPLLQLILFMYDLLATGVFKKRILVEYK